MCKECGCGSKLKLGKKKIKEDKEKGKEDKS